MFGNINWNRADYSIAEAANLCESLAYQYDRGELFALLSKVPLALTIRRGDTKSRLLSVVYQTLTAHTRSRERAMA